jgi:hypothetical protein
MTETEKLYCWFVRKNGMECNTTFSRNIPRSTVAKFYMRCIYQAEDPKAPERIEQEVLDWERATPGHSEMRLNEIFKTTYANNVIEIGSHIAFSRQDYDLWAKLERLADGTDENGRAV